MIAAAQGSSELGAASEVPPGRSLQELLSRSRALRELRKNNRVYVSIPQAEVFGEGSGYQPFCAPLLRAFNASSKTVEDLIVGIRFKTSNNKNLGSTIAHFTRMKINAEATNYFYSTINADNCHGVSGEMEIIRCMYDNGMDCTHDVRTVDYGAVPMKIMEKNKESK